MLNAFSKTQITLLFSIFTVCAVGLAVGTGYAGYKVALQNLQLTEITNKVNNAVQVANRAESKTEQLDSKQVEQIVRVVVEDRVRNTQANTINAQTGLLNSIVKNPETVAELAKANTAIQESQAKAEQALKQVETITGITPKEIETLKTGLATSQALAKETEKVDPAQLLAQYVAKNGDTLILSAVDKRLAELQTRFDKKEALLDQSIATFKYKIEQAEEAQKQYTTALNNKGDKGTADFLVTQTQNNTSRITNVETALPTYDLPVGTILAFTGSSIPSKWTLADGSAYPSTCNLIGNTPNLVGRYLKGASTAGVLGAWKTGMPSGFAYSGSTGSAGSHGHNFLIGAQSGSLGYGLSQTDNSNYFTNNSSGNSFVANAGDHSHSVSLSISGWDSLTEPQNYEVQFLVKCR